MSVVMVSEVYPRAVVPAPADGEWIDFFITKGPQKHSLYWRLNDGDRLDPDTVEFGFVSAHRTFARAEEKRRHLQSSAAAKAIA